MHLTPGASDTLAKLSEQDARTLLLELGALSALKSFDRDCAQRYAAELFGQRCTRAIIRARLVQRFGLSERSAYRLIDSVMQNCAKSAHVLAHQQRMLAAPYS